MKKEDLAVCVDNLNKILAAGAHCPMCNGREFTVVDGMFQNTIQQSFRNFNLGGPSVPCVAIVCSGCGFVSQHAIGVLNPKSFGQMKDETHE